MKIAYVMSRFPHLSETFILREMEALRAAGVEIVVYPLKVQRQAVMHREATSWLAGLRHAQPWSARAWLALARLATRSPARLARTVLRTLRENRGSAKFLLRAMAVLPMAALAAERMRSEGVDHVHAHYATHPALFAWLVHAFGGPTYSVTVHAHDIFVDRWMLSTKLEGAEFVVAISDYNRDYVLREVGEHLRERVHVVRCGIDVARYASPRSTSPATPVSRVAEIVCVGSLQPYKGQSYLIEACALLSMRGTPIRCRIVGEGAERAVLERSIARHGLEGVVQLCGPLPQDRVAEVLREADVYVQPSVIEPSGKMEGIPVALMEAMASGVPVVATRLSGIPELVRDGRTGLVVEPNDPEALSRAVSDILERPTAAAARVDEARRLVEASYELASNVAALHRLLLEVRRGVPEAPPPTTHPPRPPIHDAGHEVRLREPSGDTQRETLVWRA